MSEQNGIVKGPNIFNQTKMFSVQNIGIDYKTIEQEGQVNKNKTDNKQQQKTRTTPIKHSISNKSKNKSEGKQNKNDKRCFMR